MVDTALDDFLLRFGDNDPNKKKSQDGPKEIKDPMQGQNQTSDIAQGLAMGGNLDFNKGGGVPEQKATQISAPSEETGGIEVGEESAEKNSVDLAGGLVAGAKIVDNIGGGQYDTSAESGGAGKLSTGIVSGAADGMNLANSMGIKDPLLQGAFAVGGGLISALAHTGAQKKYRKNQAKANSKETAMEKQESADAYAMRKGEQTQGLLKGLHQKQLGLQ
jgi:hypothetical protein